MRCGARRRPRGAASLTPHAMAMHQCFNVKKELIVNYSLTGAWG